MIFCGECGTYVPGLLCPKCKRHYCPKCRKWTASNKKCVHCGYDIDLAGVTGDKTTTQDVKGS